MTNSETPSSEPRPNNPKWLAIPGLVFGGIGFADASYLSAKHLLGSPVACSILEGCDKVLTSKYAEIAGIPTALFGAFFYLAILIFTGLYLQTSNRLWLKIIVLLSTAAFTASLGFVYLQLFIIRSICVYCMGSAISSTLIFIFSLLYWRKK